METTLLSSKGQVIIPKAIRHSHRWRVGTRFVVEEVQGGVLLKPVSSFSVTDLKSGLGCANYNGAAKSLEEIQADIDAEMVQVWNKEKR